MTWTLLSESPTPPDGTEQWATITLPSAPGLVNYAFRVVVPTVTPQSWNTLGYWGIGQVVEDRAIISQTHPIPLIGRGSPQVLRLLGEVDVSLAALPSSMLLLYYCIHRWVSASTFELYGLIDD